MGILSKKKRKDSELLDELSREKLLEAIDLMKNGQFDRAFAAYAEVLSTMEKTGHVGQERYNAIKSLIFLSYKLNAKDEAYRYVGLLLLTDQAKLNICYSLFDIAKIAYDAEDVLFAKGLIKAVYQVSDGTYFAERDLKKYLEFVGIHDDRTFKDFSEDY